MKHLLGILGVCLMIGPALADSSPGIDTAPGRVMARQALKSGKKWNTADHSKFDVLKKDFKSGPEVTKACLSCHSEAADQVHQTIHWTWLSESGSNGKKMGKGGDSVNNFCISIHSNEPRCTSCHVGYGWKDKSFDFTDQTRVDCLVCHEQTGTYKKFPKGAGNPVKKSTYFAPAKKTFEPPDWNLVAQSVGRPTRQNCGTCHFFGGGGDDVKHGDMDSSLMKPGKKLDVHMGADGQNFSCVRCHSTVNHRIAGRQYDVPAYTDRKSLLEDDLGAKIACESCHSSTPHKSGSKANDHTDKVACQSCHIPEFAREHPTKMWWDWSKAGRKKDGKPIKTKGPFGKPTYMTKKGEFVWEKNVVPEYFWYNGSMETLTVHDKIDPSGVVAVNRPLGSSGDPLARITPFKVHRGKQPYDRVNKNLVIPKLLGKKGSGAYWADYDWEKSVAKGMKYAGHDFSGEVDFVETSYVFPTTHMVAPKDNVVECSQCHVQEGSRLAGITGVYMPGRDHFEWLDRIGFLSVIGAALGVLLHGLGRFVVRGRNGGKENS